MIRLLVLLSLVPVLCFASGCGGEAIIDVDPTASLDGGVDGSGSPTGCCVETCAVLLCAATEACCLSQTHGACACVPPSLCMPCP